MSIDNQFARIKLLPFSLAVFVVLLDQITKALIVKAGPIGSIIKDVFGNDLLYIWHVRNKVIAFSIGGSVPEFLRPILFIVLPVAVLVFLAIYYFKSNDFSNIQRWAVAGIIGGGAGNIIDRIFRNEGVVDFISAKWFGLTFKDGSFVPFLGYDRWPTFNIADASVVVCVFMWLISILISKPAQPDCDNQNK
ncbi:MAG: signal peptidase II [Termitinemataceae bacterium]|nr:MAG: signal peptidase II [Termitinemataceae bacterium]